MIKKRGGKRAGAGAPLLGEKKRVQIKTTVDIETRSKLKKNKEKNGESIGQFIDRSVLEKLFLLTLLILFISRFSFASASDWAACGIKPPPPIKCIHCQPVCACDAEGSCRWIFVEK